MSQITIYPTNILESGTVTVTGDPDSGYPEARIHDRSIDFLWKDTVTEAKDFHVDQGASSLDVDFLAVAAHNFDGEDLEWQHSDDDAAWTDAATDWTQADDDLIIKTLSAALTHRYWQLTLTSMANPQCAEIFMGVGYSFDVQAPRPPSGRDLDNVQWNRTVGGSERSTKFGPVRRSRTYSLFLSAAELVQFDLAMAYLDDYSNPFFVTDHAGDTFFARLAGPPNINWDHKTHTHISLSLLEVL